MKQTPTQSLSEFHDKVRELGEVAFVDTNADASEKMLMNVLVNGLRSSSMRDHVDRQHPKTLIEAMHFAREEEGRLDCRKEDEHIFHSDQNSVKSSEPQKRDNRPWDSRGQNRQGFGSERGRGQWQVYPRNAPWVPPHRHCLL